MNLDSINALLSKYNQRHLLDYYNDLDEQQQTKLLSSIRRIDFEFIQRLSNNVLFNQLNDENPNFKPIEAQKIIDRRQEDELIQIGKSSIRNGKLAVVLMAGGQGTRLGHNGPKGTYSLGFDLNVSLFHLHAQSLMRVNKMCRVYIDWYIMTSQQNYNDTIEFFTKHNYFGYPKDRIMFFIQGQLPTLDMNGKIILEDKDSISFSPDGNGGCYTALKKSGMYKKMKEDGIEWIYLCGVDNALAKLADPLFLGFTINSGKQCGNKIVKKAYPDEKVGILCYKDDKPAIVEYTELSEEHIYAKDEQGNLLYNNANILNHIISIDLIDQFLNNPIKYHYALKKVRDINNLDDSKPNGYKFESFIFDIFEYGNGVAVMEVERNEEFAPVKNKIGKDSPATACELVKNMISKLIS